MSRLLGGTATAAEEPQKTRVYHAQPANGLVPPAHKVSKIVKADGAISIVRDPTDLPAPIGSRGPRRVKVDLETVEGHLADGATYRYWTFNQKKDVTPDGNPVTANSLTNQIGPVTVEDSK